MQMQHKTEDGEAARDRAVAGYSPTWHPILAAVEDAPGEWMMMAQYGKCYAVVRYLRIGGEWGYRAVTWAERPDERALIGYYRTLRAACWAAHRRFLASHGQNGAANGR